MCDERGQLFVGPLQILEERKVYNELSEDCRKKKGGLMFEAVEYHSHKVSLMFVFILGVHTFHRFSLHRLHFPQIMSENL